jgi:hypothetical protein
MGKHVIETQWDHISLTASTLTMTLYFSSHQLYTPKLDGYLCDEMDTIISI